MSRIKPDCVQLHPDGAAALAMIAAPLLDWYHANKRAMPWREDPRPYPVWISEIMLQQTRVEAVRGYFARFLARCPDVGTLAALPEDELLKLWEGLGYYNRARNLQKAARIVCERYGGELPADYGVLRDLPGIGEYTAGAIASIAFGIRVPAADGNVYRVFSRLLASRSDISEAAVKRGMRSLAEGLVVAESNPGDFNQALMELGALVCLPNGAPLCGRCPLSAGCEAKRLGCAGELPVKAAKKPRRIELRTICLIRAGDSLLLFKRPGAGLLRGMYEPLNLEGHLTREQIGRYLEGFGAGAASIDGLPGATHIFSHVEWQMRAWEIKTAAFPPPEGAVWAREGELAIPAAFRYWKQGDACDE